MIIFDDNNSFNFQIWSFFFHFFCCSAPCRFPEAFHLARSFTNQPDHQPTVRLRLRVPQVGVSWWALRRTVHRVSQPLSRAEPEFPQQCRKARQWWKNRDSGSV